jgi:hypothetical protein
MIADRSQVDLYVTFQFLDDAGNGITSLAWNTPNIEISYLKKGATAWVPLTLVAGTLGTYLSSSFIADSGGNGLYQLGIPNEAKVAGHRTYWRFKYAANQYRYDSIDYVSIPSAETSNATFEFSIPGVETVFTTESTIYIRELEVDVAFTANQDITAIPLVLILEDSEGVDHYVISDSEMTKVGDTVTVRLPDDFTESERTLTWGIRNASNQRVYGTGSISVTYAPYEG